MHPGIDAPLQAPECDDLAASGGAFAAALLQRIGQGVSNPDDLVTLMQFLSSGPMLHGACAVLFVALRKALQPGGQGAPVTHEAPAGEGGPEHAR